MSSEMSVLQQNQSLPETPTPRASGTLYRQRVCMHLITYPVHPCYLPGPPVHVCDCVCVSPIPKWTVPLHVHVRLTGQSPLCPCITHSPLATHAFVIFFPF